MSALDKAIEIIKKFEGCRLNAYPDPATGGEPWTIGWGTTFYENGQKVKKGDIITQDRADYLLEQSVKKFMNKTMALIKVPLPPNRLAALTSFAYNCGIGNLKQSTLLKKVNANPEDTAIKNEFMKWNKAAGKVMKGLTKRRSAEADLYFSK